MHILIVSTYYEPDSGAAAVRLSRLAKMLRARDHTVTVLTTLPHYPVGKISAAYHGRWSVVEDRDGVRVIRCWLWATPSPKISRKLISQMSFMANAMLRGVAVQRPDVVLIEAQPVFTGLAGVFLSRLKRVPYVLNVSDLWPDHLLSVGALKENHAIYRLARRVVDRMYRGASQIVSLSPAWMQKIIDYTGAREKNRVIYNGVDLTRFRPDRDASAFRVKYGLAADKPLVTFIGSFATQYDFDVMFAVVERLLAKRDVYFAFIGDGSQAARVAAFAHPQVQHIPWINHEEIPLAWAASTVTFWAMRDHDLYAGTIPAKLYEALACGVPVAASMRGEGARMIHESGGGVVVPPGDVAGLGVGVKQLLDDPEVRQRMCVQARRYAEATFAPERVTDAYEDVLRRAVQG